MLTLIVYVFFVRLIFVAAIDYENIFIMKISRFTVLLAKDNNIMLLGMVSMKRFLCYNNQQTKVHAYHRCIY